MTGVQTCALPILLFERFLSEERGEWPDIDLDLPSGDQREKVIQYVYRRYGAHGAAMTATVISYRTRSAVREVGKALGLSLAEVKELNAVYAIGGSTGAMLERLDLLLGRHLADVDSRIDELRQLRDEIERYRERVRGRAGKGAPAAVAGTGEGPR